MQSGKELDILVAEKVMGHRVAPDPAARSFILLGADGTVRLMEQRGAGPDVHPYSTSIASAMLVLEKVREMGKGLMIEVGSCEAPYVITNIRVDDGDYSMLPGWPESPLVNEYADSLEALAATICRVALAAVGYQLELSEAEDAAIDATDLPDANLWQA